MSTVLIVDVLPKPDKLPNGTTYGTYSVTLPNKTKLIPYQYARKLGDETDTETGWTRKFLSGLPRRKWRRAEFDGYKIARPPLFVIPARLRDAVYLDIKSAYPSVYKILGWKIDYLRGRYMGVNDKLIYPYPAAWKAGRSYVISGARHRQNGRYIFNGTIKSKPYASPFANPQLVAGVYDVLSMFATLAHRLGGVYWNVDGGIMPAKAAEIMQAALASVGLEGRIKYEGDATILSAGYWQIGGHATAQWEAERNSGIYACYRVGMTSAEADWVYTKFRGAYENQK